MRSLAVFWLALLFLLTGKASLATTDDLRLRAKRFPVKEVRGRVLAWDPWDSQWESVKKGKFLWEGSLIQLGAESSLTLELKASEGFKGLKADLAQMTLNRPMVIRLTENELRRVQLNSYFIPRFPEVTSKEVPKTDTMQLKFQEAWERFAAILAKQDKNTFSWLKPSKDEKQSEAEVAVRSKKIKIFSPRDGSIAFADRLPFALRVSWEKIPEPNVKYDIRVWKVTAPQPKPMAVTTSEYYTVPILSEGTYFVQVGALDGRYQSSVHRIHIDSTAPRKIASLKGGKTIIGLPLEMKLPPDRFQYQSKKFPASVSFEWESAAGPPRDPDYLITLTDEKGTLLLAQHTRATQYQLAIAKPGKYQWQVESLVNLPGVKLPARSLIRSFELLPARVSGSEDPLANLFLAKSGSKFLYLEDGF